MIEKIAVLAALAVMLPLAAAAEAPPSMHHHSVEVTGDHHRAHDRPDDHAPIGVMGDHLHHKGGLMLSYRYMRMRMDGNLEGTSSVSNGQIFAQGFAVAPLSMDTEMHMFGAMYAPHEKVTLTLMVPWVRKSMDHITAMGVQFTTRSSGIGDLRLGGLVGLVERGRHKLHANFSVSFPTGSIDARDNIPINPNAILPYPMQLGSGSFGLVPGLTYLGSTERWFSWGGQATGTIWLDKNSRDYRVGNSYEVTGWGSVPWADWVSTSLRFKWRQAFNYSGADPALNPSFVPTANPNLRGGRRVDGSLGFNLKVPRGSLRELRFAAEAGLPLYQSLDGPQLEAKWWVVAGFQYGW